MRYATVHIVHEPTTRGSVGWPEIHSLFSTYHIFRIQPENWGSTTEFLSNLVPWFVSFYELFMAYALLSLGNKNVHELDSS